MTGRYPGRFGPQAIHPSNLRALQPGTVTLASALQSLGYVTFQAGKWHLGSRPEWGPNAYGFDHSYGTLTGAADPWTHKYRSGPYEDTWHRDGVRLDEEGNATELVTAEAERRIREGGVPAAAGDRKPWFLYVPFHAVHTPVDAPDEFKRLYDGVRFADDPAKHDSRLRLAAMISQLDASIGRLVTALDETGQRRDTLIVFTSDNGGIESLGLAHTIEQAVVQSCLCIDELARQQHLHGLFDGHVAHQRHTGRGAEQAVLNTAGGEAGIAAGHGQIALRHQLAACSRCNTLHSCNDGHRQLLYRKHHAAALGKQLLVVSQLRVPRHILEVMPCAKGPALGRQHHHTHLLIPGHGIQRQLQGGEHFAAQGVEALRIAQSDASHAALVLAQLH
jgi:hypothetical protein